MAVDFDNEVILVTAASGKQASQLIPHLAKKWKHLRLLVNSEGSKQLLSKQYPNAEVLTGDVTNAQDCHRIFQGVAACYMITPAFMADEVQCGKNMIDAALANVRSGGPFKHMLFSSVIHPSLRALVNHDSKRYVEEYLIESGLPYTVIQPTHLMETFPVQSIVSQDNPVRPAAWNPATKFSFVSTIDVGEAAAIIFEHRDQHLYATYQLVGTPTPLSYDEAMEIVSEESGKEIRNEKKPLEQAAEMIVTTAGKDKPQEVQNMMRQGFSRMFLHYNEHGLIGNPNIVRMLLGREPLDYRAWVKKSLQK